jgi:hypothetical protein
LGTVDSSLSNSSLVGTDRIDNEFKISANIRRLYIKYFLKMGAGEDSASLITNSVDCNFRNLISYLESINSGQETQRVILEIFSNSSLS